jgi:hypothetical protein
MDGTASAPSRRLDREVLAEFLRAVEAGEKLDETIALLESDADAQLALAEMYGLPTAGGRLDFSLTNRGSVWRGKYTFILEAETLPGSLGSPTQSLLIKLLRPSHMTDSNALAALDAEARATEAAFDRRLLHASPYALVSLKAAGVALETWLMDREWLTQEKDPPIGPPTHRRLEAVRDIGLALCRALRTLSERTHNGHDNLALSSILVVEDPSGLDVNLVDFAADAPEEHEESSLRFMRGYPSSTIRDAYGVGIAMLQTATPYRIVIDGQSTAETVQRALADLWGDAPGFARIIEDLVDGKPSQRLLMLTQSGVSEHPWADLADLIQGEYELLTLFRAPPTESGGTDVSIATWSQVRRYFDVARQIKLGVRANWPASNLLKWLNLLAYSFWVLALSGFVILTSADLGLSTPGGSAAQFIGQYADFKLGHFWSNFPGRFIALSFAYTALMFYMRILSGVTVRRLGLPWIEICLRSVPIVLNALAIVVIYYDPQWWPMASTIGLAAVVITNWMLALLDRKALDAMRSPFGYPDAAVERAELARNRHKSWWRTAAIYLAIVIVLDVCLYRTHILHDEAFYAIVLAIGVNFYALYWNSIRKLDRLVRGCLEQSSFVLRRAEHLRASASKPTIFRSSEVPGGALAFIPAVVVLALVAFSAAREDTLSVAWILVAFGCTCAAAAAVSLILRWQLSANTLSANTANARLAITVGGLVWATISIAALEIAGWGRLPALLLSAAIALIAGDQVFRRASGEKAASESKRTETPSESLPDITEIFRAAEEGLLTGHDASSVSFELGLGLTGGSVASSPENIEANLLATWQASPHVGRLAELLLLPASADRLIIDSAGRLRNIHSEISHEISPRHLMASGRAAVCLDAPGLELSTTTALTLRAAGAASLLIALVCSIGWIYFAIADPNLTRTAGRTLALTYSLSAAYYYRVLVGWITVAGMRRGGTEIALRSVPFVFQGPAITAIYFWPSLWPLQATIGVGATALVNYLLLRIVRDAETTIESQPTWRVDRNVRGRKTPFESWWTTACIYLAGVLVFDVLLTATGILHDGWLYALLLGFGANVYVICFSSLRKNGAAARGQIIRATVLLRALQSAPQKRHVRIAAPRGLLFVQASIVGLCALWMVLAHENTTTMSLGASALLTATAILLAGTLAAQYLEADPLSPRAEASARLSATLACWAIGLGTFAAGETLSLPYTPGIVFLACSAVAIGLGEKKNPVAHASSVVLV